MIKDSIDKAIEKYGNIKVKFTYYYKYTFIYTSTIGDLKISVYIGGDSSDIYKIEVNPENFESLITLNPYHVEVRDNLGNLIEEYDD